MPSPSGQKGSWSASPTRVTSRSPSSRAPPRRSAGTIAAARLDCLRAAVMRAATEQRRWVEWRQQEHLRHESDAYEGGERESLGGVCASEASNPSLHATPPPARAASVSAHEWQACPHATPCTHHHRRARAAAIAQRHCTAACKRAVQGTAIATRAPSAHAPSAYALPFTEVKE